MPTGVNTMTSNGTELLSTLRVNAEKGLNSMTNALGSENNARAEK